MSFTIHSDKWSHLKSITDEFGVKALSRFERPSTIEEQQRAIAAVTKALKQDDARDLSYDVLHSSNIGFIRYALDPSYAPLQIEDMMALALKNTKNSEVHSTIDGWKDGLFSQTFRAAVNAKTLEEQEHVINIFEKISEADLGKSQHMLEQLIEPDPKTGKVDLRAAILHDQKEIKKYNPEWEFISPSR